MKIFLPTIFLFFFFNSVNAQNVTGTWEGRSGGELFQLNLTQSGTQVCGYTYDHSLSNVNDFCKAYFIGRYEDGLLTLTGTGFIAKSYNHVLMRITLMVEYENNGYVLVGRIQVGASSFSGMADGSLVKLRRIKSVPNKIPGTNSACYNSKSTILDPLDEGSNPNPEPVEILPAPKPPVNVKPNPKPPINSKPTVKPPPATKPTVKPPVNPVQKPQQKPAVKPTVQAKPKIILREPDPLPATIAKRKKVEQGRLSVNVKEIMLKLYDNGVVDGDTVSVYYNGKLIVNKQRLSEKPIEIPITLEDNVSAHEIVLFAENLGGIAPNTALVVVTAGKKRYELRSSADLSKNAVLVFEYVPD